MRARGVVFEINTNKFQLVRFSNFELQDEVQTPNDNTEKAKIRNDIFSRSFRVKQAWELDAMWSV